MKKLIFFAIAAVFAMVSCNKEKVEPNQEPVQITFNLTANHPDEADATKAVKTGWVDNDVIFVFFSGATAPMYLEMKREGSSWVFDSKNDLALVNGSTGTMRAVYLPFGSDVNVGNDSSNYTFSRTDYTYYLTATLDYTVVNGVVSGTFDMSWPDGFVQFSMPIKDGSRGITFFREGDGQYTLSENHITPTGIASIAADGTITETDDKSLGDPMVGYYYGTGNDRCILFSGVLGGYATPTETLYNFTFVNNMGTDATYDDVTYKLSGTKTLYTDATHNRAIKFPLISSNRWKVPVLEGTEGYVEIKGVKWAKWNIGATTPGGYGDYFSWGATYPQAKYENSDYRESGISIIDNNLTAANDVAIQKLGTDTDWHMPTQKDIESILNTSTNNPADGVTWTWISDTSTYGTTGYEVYLTSDSSKKIFLPAAGYWGNGLDRAGEYGYCWSTEFVSSSNARILCFHGSYRYWPSVARYFGRSVRPVHK